MRRVARILLALGAALIAFAGWGLFTAAGARVFDEMDGLIPFFAGLLGLVLGGALVRRR